MANPIGFEKARNDGFANGPRMAFLVQMWAKGKRTQESLEKAAARARRMGAESDAQDLEWMAEHTAGGSPQWEKDIPEQNQVS